MGFYIQLGIIWIYLVKKGFQPSDHRLKLILIDPSLGFNKSRMKSLIFVI